MRTSTAQLASSKQKNSTSSNGGKSTKLKLAQTRSTTELKSLEKTIKYFGSQAQLGEALGVQQAQISLWLCRDKKIGVSSKILKLEQLTNGLVTRYQLRPDIYGKAPTLKSTAKQLLQILKQQTLANIKQIFNSKLIKYLVLPIQSSHNLTRSIQKFNSPTIILLGLVLVLTIGFSIGTINSKNPQFWQVSNSGMSSSSGHSTDYIKTRLTSGSATADKVTKQ